jgi:hypothetical protein
MQPKRVKRRLSRDPRAAIGLPWWSLGSNRLDEIAALTRGRFEPEQKGKGPQHSLRALEDRDGRIELRWPPAILARLAVHPARPSDAPIGRSANGIRTSEEALRPA